MTACQFWAVSARDISLPNLPSHSSGARGHMSPVDITSCARKLDQALAEEIERRDRFGHQADSPEINSSCSNFWKIRTPESHGGPCLPPSLLALDRFHIFTLASEFGDCLSNAPKCFNASFSQGTFLVAAKSSNDVPLRTASTDSRRDAAPARVPPG